MSTHYRQLTLGQRYQIQALIAAGLTNAEIARQLNCHRSTIGRERSRCPGRYRAKKAQDASDSRRRAAYKYSRFAPKLWVCLKRNLGRHLSPEMVAGRMRLDDPALLERFGALLDALVPELADRGAFVLAVGNGIDGRLMNDTGPTIRSSRSPFPPRSAETA